MDQVRCPVIVPRVASIHHTVIWAELDPTHYFLLNRPHYPVTLNTHSRIIFMVFPRPLNDFVDWQSSLDLPSSNMEDILSSMFVPDHHHKGINLEVCARLGNTVDVLENRIRNQKLIWKIDEDPPFAMTRDTEEQGQPRQKYGNMYELHEYQLLRDKFC